MFTYWNGNLFLKIFKLFTVHLFGHYNFMPPELKLRDGGKYVLKKIARGRVPDSVIDRPKGYFPVPALKFVRGEFLDMMRDILHSQKAQERGLYNAAYVDKVLTKPEAHLTRIKGSKLWHMALLEMWLQSQHL